jgi:MSHA biogenesis protein MshK
LALLATANGQALDDPTRPYRSASPGGPGEAARPFELSGVLLAPNRRVAVINGGLYREGDLVNGARVVRIEPRSVRLQRGDQSLVVELSGEPPQPLLIRGEPTS